MPSRLTTLPDLPTSSAAQPRPLPNGGALERLATSRTIPILTELNTLQSPPLPAGLADGGAAPPHPCPAIRDPRRPMGLRSPHLPNVAGLGCLQTRAPTMAPLRPPTGPLTPGVGASLHKLILRSLTPMHLAQAAPVKQPLNAAGTMTQTMTLTSRPMTQHWHHPAAARVLGVPLDLIGWITRPLPLL